MTEQENVALDAQPEMDMHQEQEVVNPGEQEIASSAQQAQQNDDKERNFAELREAKRRLEREVREMRERLEEVSRPRSEDLSDDDLVEGKHLKAYVAQIEQKLAQAQQATIPDRLRSKFADFDSVVSPENVEKLKEAEPELFESITSGSNLYSKGISAYKAIKKFGIVQDDTYAAEKERVGRSHSRPMSTQAVKGQGALHETNVFANGLTPELRKQLYQEMMDAAKAQ